jgi:hypothetical protein
MDAVELLLIEQSDLGSGDILHGILLVRGREFLLCALLPEGEKSAGRKLA